MKMINAFPHYYPSSVYFQKNVVPAFALLMKCVLAFGAMLSLFMGGAYLVDVVVSAMF